MCVGLRGSRRNCSDADVPAKVGKGETVVDFSATVAPCYDLGLGPLPTNRERWILCERTVAHQLNASNDGGRLERENADESNVKRETTMMFLCGREEGGGACGVVYRGAGGSIFFVLRLLQKKGRREMRPTHQRTSAASV